MEAVRLAEVLQKVKCFKCVSACVKQQPGNDCIWFSESDGNVSMSRSRAMTRLHVTHVHGLWYPGGGVPTAPHSVLFCSGIPLQVEEPVQFTSVKDQSTFSELQHPGNVADQILICGLWGTQVMWQRIGKTWVGKKTYWNSNFYSTPSLLRNEWSEWKSLA